MSYCSYIPSMKEPNRSLHKNYHDNHYGFPIHDDNELFDRLIMEINQAGLSWETILKKEEHFRQAYDNFNIKKVAEYTEADRKRLLADAGIIRNKLFWTKWHIALVGSSLWLQNLPFRRSAVSN